MKRLLRISGAALLLAVLAGCVGMGPGELDISSGDAPFGFDQGFGYPGYGYAPEIGFGLGGWGGGWGGGEGWGGGDDDD